MKFNFLTILIMLSMSMLCCTSNVKSHGNLQEDHLYSTQQEDGIPSSIDSAIIIMKYRYEVEFTIRQDRNGYVKPTDSSIGKGFELSNEYCNNIIADMDSIFIKKLYPVEKSRSWHPYITESDALPIKYDITLYSNGKQYHQNIQYKVNQGFCEVEYSLAFKRLAQNLYVFGGPNTFRL